MTQGHRRNYTTLTDVTLEVVQAEFFLELLMRLFADPAGLDGAGKLLDRSIDWEVGEVVFALAG